MVALDLVPLDLVPDPYPEPPGVAAFMKVQITIAKTVEKLKK